MEDEMKYVHWLASLGALTGKEKCRLTGFFGSERELYFQIQGQILRAPELKQGWLEAVLEHKKAWKLEQEYELLNEQGITLTASHLDSYPRRLKNICDPPYCLYVKGKLPDESKKTAAIVGARACSEYGLATARTIGRQLAEAGMEVVSGLALGIDGAAQRGALYGGGATYGIMGCGVDVCYPAGNRRLYQDVIKQGGILSENPVATPPRPYLFPMRNRIISGLADAVILVEAREKSGSLITADCALEQGKDIYAVPGRMWDTLSRGTNRLIAQGASPFLSVEEFLQEMGVAGSQGKNKKKLIENSLEKNECLVYSVLDLTPKNLDWLMTTTQLSLKELLKILSRLREQGYIKEVYQNYYMKTVDRQN